MTFFIFSFLFSFSFYRSLPLWLRQMIKSCLQHANSSFAILGILQHYQGLRDGKFEVIMHINYKTHSKDVRLVREGRRICYDNMIIDSIDVENVYLSLSYYIYICVILYEYVFVNDTKNNTAPTLGF